MSTMQEAVTIFFYVLSGLSAVSILFVKNVFKAALLLLICLLSIGALYILMIAEFIAVAQILIYAGGIVILILFGVMLTTKMSGQPLHVGTANMIGGTLVMVAMCFILIVALQSTFKGTMNAEGPQENQIAATGIQLMTSYMLPFELSGILLLIALIGAAVVATSGSRKPGV
jgi:NADH:ubiquinone oxidoreductase subunit 6 (subunit J)